ncbi:hypothetical protein BTU51_0335 [Rickettsia rickettsii]|uniref:Uncharacterized protein n=3 Tax=spotted fever group TaxID=114277 RepID=B0BWK9_RICRO|nr:hypothetical protein RrIowa_0335 [Rickettsia rickettsii str. Iowa]APU55187.1 hypothetical protein BTU50_0335 [Rickettsia rickettsii]APU56564.1 hypothetical protein BTU51_0335 [Rickettsia rickettsii]
MILKKLQNNSKNIVAISIMKKKISLLKLEKLIRDLKDFEDGEKKVEEVTLEEILDKWEELREEIREID